MKALPPSANGFANILAQAPVVSAAFGRWLGFVVIVTALLEALALCGLAILILFGDATR